MENKTSEQELKQPIQDVVVTIKMKPDEKTLLIRKAVKESGLSISEFIRYKLFNEEPESHAKNEEPVFKEVVEDEERQAYEELLKNQRIAIADLTEQLYKAKSKNIDLTEKPDEIAKSILTEENRLFIESLLSDKGKEMLLKKRGLWGGKFDTDLSSLATSELLNASINYIKELTEDESYNYQLSFNNFLKK